MCVTNRIPHVAKEHRAATLDNLAVEVSHTDPGEGQRPERRWGRTGAHMHCGYLFGSVDRRSCGSPRRYGERTMVMRRTIKLLVVMLVLATGVLVAAPAAQAADPIYSY